MTRIKIEEADYSIEMNFDIRSRIIYLSGVIEDTVALDIIKKLRILDMAENKPITLTLDSPGGDIIASFAIYDFIRNCRSFVNIETYGKAMSGGSLILQAGDRRLMSASSSMLIHYGTQGYEGDHHSFGLFAKESARLADIMETIYYNRIKEKNPKFVRNDLKDLMKFDTYLASEEAVKLGLVDQIIPSQKSYPAKLRVKRVLKKRVTRGKA